MKIIKLSNAVDPVKMIKKKCLDRDMACPFCRNSSYNICYDKNYENNWFCINIGGVKPDIYYDNEKWYGTQDGKTGFFRRGKRYWMKYRYTCGRCGAKWEGEPFPVDIGGQI